MAKSHSGDTNTSDSMDNSHCSEISHSIDKNEHSDNYGRIESNAISDSRDTLKHACDTDTSV